jgi:hypothetical protein
VLLAVVQILIGAGGRGGTSARVPAGDADTTDDPSDRVAETVAP